VTKTRVIDKVLHHLKTAPREQIIAEIKEMIEKRYGPGFVPPQEDHMESPTYITVDGIRLPAWPQDYSDIDIQHVDEKTFAAANKTADKVFAIRDRQDSKCIEVLSPIMGYERNIDFKLVASIFWTLGKSGMLRLGVINWTSSIVFGTSQVAESFYSTAGGYGYNKFAHAMAGARIGRRVCDMRGMAGAGLYIVARQQGFIVVGPGVS
jgi:hypothetical protein